MRSIINNKYNEEKNFLTEMYKRECDIDSTNEIKGISSEKKTSTSSENNQ